jgi:hypothetical protein
MNPAPAGAVGRMPQTDPQVARNMLWGERSPTNYCSAGLDRPPSASTSKRPLGSPGRPAGRFGRIRPAIACDFFVAVGDGFNLYVLSSSARHALSGCEWATPSQPGCFSSSEVVVGADARYQLTGQHLRGTWTIRSSVGPRGAALTVLDPEPTDLRRVIDDPARVPGLDGPH